MSENEGGGFLFGRGSRFAEFATKLSELMWLNLLTIVCSIPVITLGAAFCAMHRVLVQIYRDEEKGITKAYFNSFKENFPQATKIWLLYILYFGVLFVDDFALRALKDPTIQYLRILVPLLSILGILSLQWFFVMQSRYDLGMKDTIVYSFTRIIAFPLRTIVMGFSLIAPLLVAALFPISLIVMLLIGLSGGGLLAVCAYNGALKVMEDDSGAETGAASDGEAGENKEQRGSENGDTDGH